MIVQLALLAALAAPGVSKASSVSKLAAPGGGTITISAQLAKYNLTKRLIDYTGNPVRLTRGDEVLVCKHLTAQLDETDKVQQAICEGDVRFDRGDKTITCDKATYEEAASRLTCEGHAVMKSGGLTARGTKVVYDIVPDEVTMNEVTGDLPGNKADAALRQQQARRKARQEAQK